jgi:hypothetical protein
MSNRDKLDVLLATNTTAAVQTTHSIAKTLYIDLTEANLKATERAIQTSSIRFEPLIDKSLVDEHGRPAKRLVLDQLMATARKKKKLILFAQLLESEDGLHFIALNDARGGRRWMRLSESDDCVGSLHDALISLCEFEQKEIVLIPSGPVVEAMRRLVKQHHGQRLVDQDIGSVTIALEIYTQSRRNPTNRKCQSTT